MSCSVVQVEGQEQADLGKLRFLGRPGRVMIPLLGALVILPILVGVGLFVLFAITEGMIWAWLIAAALAVAGVRVVTGMVRFLRSSIEIREHGIILRPGGRVVHWVDVEEAYYSATQMTINGVPTPVQFGLSLLPRGGEKIMIGSGYRKQQVMVETALRLVHPHLYRRAIGQLQREGRARFGPITLTRSAILLEKKKGHTIGLDEVRGCRLDRGSLVLVGHDDAPLFAHPFAKIPNVMVLRQLLSR